MSTAKGKGGEANLDPGGEDSGTPWGAALAQEGSWDLVRKSTEETGINSG